MPRDSRDIRGRSQGAPAPLDVLGPYYRGVQVRRILWPTLQGVPRSYPGIPPVPHTLQRGCGRYHLTLGDGGGGNIGGHGGTWHVDTVPVRVFLCQRWNRCLDSTGQAAEGVQRLHVPL